jgi:AcrR family transcriptional regulator
MTMPARTEDTAIAQEPGQPDGAIPVQARKSTQQQRLIAATIQAIASNGYMASTIADIIERAGVSRPTFYDYFPDKEACLLAVTASIHEDLCSSVEAAVAGTRPSDASYATVAAVVAFFQASPAMAQVALNVGLEAGLGALAAREQGASAVAHAIDTAHLGLAADDLVPDLDARLLVGGVYRLLASRLRGARPIDAEVAEELGSWLGSYAVPAGERRWATLKQPAPAGVSAAVTEPPFGSVALATRERSRERRTERHRQRVLFATGELAREKGLASTSVAEIATRAGVGYRRFCSFFDDKHAAFLALHELGYRRLFAATARAHFSGATWPDRTWAAGKVYAEFVSRNPTVAKIGFIESYAAGPRAAIRMDNAIKMFTLFLREGNAQLCDGARPVTELGLDAIGAVIFELAASQILDGKSAQLETLLPAAVYIALAPFLGVEEAVRFVEGKVGAVEAGDG